MNRTLLSLLATTLLAGCAVGPNYVKPDLALTPAFHTPVPAAVPGAPTASLDAWWTAFGDAELSRIAPGRAGRRDRETRSWQGQP